MKRRIRIAIAGVGKIARDQHIPAIAAGPDFEWVAAVSRSPVAEVPLFPDVAAMMATMPDVEAIAICTPPLGRLAIAGAALDAGLDVLMEKPPAATIGEAEAIVARAASAGRVLYTSWHLRHAPGIAPARDWLKGRRIDRVTVTWRENVRQWHPGQEWIWEPGIGTFDPGINALSAITAIVPEPLLLQSSDLRFPANRAAPVSADLALLHGSAPVSVALAIDQAGQQSWDIIIETDGGPLALSHGASQLAIGGVAQAVADTGEYPSLYAHFAELLAARRSDTDISPLRLVADAFMLARRSEVAAFDW